MAQRHFGSPIRISDLMSCNACQEQHLLKRCLSDGQKCAGANLTAYTWAAPPFSIEETCFFFFLHFMVQA